MFVSWGAETARKYKADELVGMLEAAVSADDRKELKAGDKVTIALESDESKTYEGTVRYISELPDEDSETIQYKVIVDFTPDENAVFGMSVIVTTGEKSATITEEGA